VTLNDWWAVCCGKENAASGVFLVNSFGVHSPRALVRTALRMFPPPSLDAPSCFRHRWEPGMYQGHVISSRQEACLDHLSIAWPSSWVLTLPMALLLHP
jgi:hypothetical protein